jgi:hypothetical protein
MALWHCARPLQYVLETETDSLAARSVFRSLGRSLKWRHGQVGLVLQDRKMETVISSIVQPVAIRSAIAPSHAACTSRLSRQEDRADCDPRAAVCNRRRRRPVTRETTMRLIDLANPSRFVALTDRMLPWVAMTTLAAFAIGVNRVYLAPDDYQQGAAVKIMFIHVPAAWLLGVLHPMVAREAP